MKENQEKEYQVTSVTPEDGVVSKKKINHVIRDYRKQRGLFYGYAQNATFSVKNPGKGKAFVLMVGLVFAAIALLLLLSGSFFMGLLLLAADGFMVHKGLEGVRRSAEEMHEKLPETGEEILQAGKELMEDFKEPGVYVCKSTFTKENVQKMKKTAGIFYLIIAAVMLLIAFLTHGVVWGIGIAVVLAAVWLIYFGLVNLIVKIMENL